VEQIAEVKAITKEWKGVATVFIQVLKNVPIE
jgi:hypothetical protein